MSGLDQANQAIALLEEQLTAQLAAEHHPRWDDGRLVLIGDVGVVAGKPDCTVLEIFGRTGKVWVRSAEGDVHPATYGECSSLTYRGRLLPS
ncbi:MAG: hypothetical protein GY941_18020 [Planctomycetes bacterium]|nr:hypothetical protein [Planctomycetota bacterium]